MKLSQAASGYERISGERYFTPEWPVQALLSKERFYGTVIDPCAGGWDIIRELRRQRIQSYGFDIEPPSDDVGEGMVMYPSQDFLAWDGEWSNGKSDPWDSIISNFPYGVGGRQAVKFIEHGLDLLKGRSGKMAVLLRMDFDSAHGRRSIFGDHPAFAAKYVLTKRVRWANVEQSTAGPSDNHAWYVWDWLRPSVNADPLAIRYGYLP